MDLANFTQKVLENFRLRITDEVFLMIQNDRVLMRDYLQAVSENGKDTVNRYLGKAVKKEFDLEDLPSRQEEPKSTLIGSHQEY